ncbi:MAG: type II toxin-antitoxin system VapB family antitoxin [bacterium]|nr:type II toxin-antitoxin system VapB family antitoxin [bacterium]
MRTTLDLPEKLLEQATSLSKESTKKGTIIKALREYIRLKKLEKLARSAGSIKFSSSYSLAKARHSR